MANTARALGSSLLLSLGALAAASPLDEAAAWLRGGEAALDFRYRFERVDQEGPRRDARASTLRSRLTLTSATVRGFTGQLEVDDLSTPGPERYDSLLLDNPHFGEAAVVADPPGTELNQAWLGYAEGPWTATLGRQRITHGGHRFLGNVGWRQNEQTYDALRLQYQEGALALDYAFLARVNRIFAGEGKSAQPERFEGASHALLGSAALPVGTLSAFLYALDFDEAVALSTLTWGLAYDVQLGPLALSAAAARQTDHADNPDHYAAPYLFLEARYGAAPVTLVAGYERLGSDGGERAFVTPLATLHKFQGWADQFLVTPADGLEDLYGGASAAVGPVKVGLYLHHFAADRGGEDYGSEVDWVITWPLHPRLSLELKYAAYDADAFATDTDKLWFTAQANF